MKLLMDDYDPHTRFCGRYYHRGAWFTFEFYADNWADAEDLCLAHNLQLDGEHVVTIPVVGGVWLPNLIVWVHNIFK